MKITLEEFYQLITVFFQKSPPDTKQTPRLTVSDGEMQQKTVTEIKFLQFNDKRFYFSNRTTSLPLSYSYLKDQNKYKEEKGQRIKKYFWQEKDNLLAMENKSQLLNERLSAH